MSALLVDFRYCAFSASHFDTDVPSSRLSRLGSAKRLAIQGWLVSKILADLQGMDYSAEFSHGPSLVMIHGDG